MSFSGFFIKFGQLDHIIALHTKGQLYFGPISYFSKLEDSNLRGDNLEDVIEFRYIGNSKIYLKPVDAPDEEFKSMDAVDVKFTGRRTDPIGNLFCLYALNAYDEPVNTRFNLDARVKEFGSHFMIILDTTEFLKRVTTVLENQRFKWSCSLVEYVDFSKYTGKKSVFQKDIKYNYQKEFRIFIENSEVKPIMIEVGDLSDISMICAANIVDTLKIHVAAKDGDKNILRTNLSEPKRVIHVLRELSDFSLELEGKQFHFQALKDEAETSYRISVDNFCFRMNVTEQEIWKFADSVPKWLSQLERELGQAINEANRKEI